jgi:hypothetical protein
MSLALYPSRVRSNEVLGGIVFVVEVRHRMGLSIRNELAQQLPDLPGLPRVSTSD